MSMGKPANLPDFKGLADKIAEHTGETRENNETVDQFLGRLVGDHGINIHEIAAGVLTATKPQPTSLHRNLLHLFQGGADSIRMVTTNFDLLFEEAFKRIFSTELMTYRASALPRGENFKGIVHVHGDVTVPSDMVLTDEDFGRAYLTGGWARRFLSHYFKLDQCFSSAIVIKTRSWNTWLAPSRSPLMSHRASY